MGRRMDTEDAEGASLFVRLHRVHIPVPSSLRLAVGARVLNSWCDWHGAGDSHLSPRTQRRVLAQQPQALSFSQSTVAKSPFHQQPGSECNRLFTTAIWNFD